MEVLSHSPNQSPTMDHFDFNRLSPYLSAPSSPKRFGEDFYLSAPTSPSRFLSQFEDEEEEDDVGFAFCVNRDSDSSPRSAEELFFGGKIKPLESAKSPLLSPNRVKNSPISKGKKAIIQAFLPKNKKDSSLEGTLERRGRDRTPASEFSNSGRRVTRSHSPYRTSKYTWVEEQQQRNHQQQQQHSNNKEESSVPVTKSSSRIWRLRDFLLFRSASEGRGTSKDPFRKYSVSYNNKKLSSEEGKGGSSSSSSSILPPIPPRNRKKENGVSAHELHYARKKAESEDLKKRTFLPYKQGILGRLAGLGSNTR